MLEVKNAFCVLLFVCLFFSFIEGFFLLVFKPCWKKTFLLRAPLGCPSLGCSRREGSRRNLGGFVVFKKRLSCCNHYSEDPVRFSFTGFQDSFLHVAAGPTGDSGEKKKNN